MQLQVCCKRLGLLQGLCLVPDACRLMLVMTKHCLLLICVLCVACFWELAAWALCACWCMRLAVILMPAAQLLCVLRSFAGSVCCMLKHCWCLVLGAWCLVLGAWCSVLTGLGLLLALVACFLQLVASNACYIYAGLEVLLVIAKLLINACFLVCVACLFNNQFGAPRLMMIACCHIFAVANCWWLRLSIYCL